MYQPPFFLRNAHISSILPNVLRKVNGIEYQPERIKTSDNDFLDLFYSSKGNNKAVILVHGLEGHAKSDYMKGMAKALIESGYDVISFNQRGCSKEPNLLPNSYHSGKSEDLNDVVENIASKNRFNELNLIGFSLGGNLILKYLGEDKYSSTIHIKKAVSISAPVDLKNSVLQLSKKSNRIYMNRFLRLLKPKIEQKINNFSSIQITAEQLNSISNFYEFDDLYTAPANGYINGNEYYQKCSSKQFLTSINTPTLMISAMNDPFLGKECYPINEINANSKIQGLFPKYGGHVGFSTNLSCKGRFWHEQQAINFLKS